MMTIRKLQITILPTLLGLVLTAGPVWAGQKENDADEFKLPRWARETREDVYDLGTSFDRASGRLVRGIAFVHRERPVVAASDPVCYGYIAADTKWRSSETFLLNPNGNRSGLAASGVLSVFNNALGKWEDAANGTVDDGIKVEIVGDASLTSNRLRADYGYPDSKNEAYFARISGGSIAVTIVWYVPATKTIVETDQVYNNRYAWSAQETGVAGKMDLDNIVTHEHGHVFGLNDQYDSYCAAVTMYGYADYGETNKRSLESPDITGIDLLY